MRLTAYTGIQADEVHCRRYVELATKTGGALNAFYDDGSAAKARLREAILRHLREHPDVADTAEGIVGWWLPRTGYEDAPDHIAAVLEDLVARDWLRTVEMPDGKVLYQRGDAVGILDGSDPLFSTS